MYMCLVERGTEDVDFADVSPCPVLSGRKHDWCWFACGAQLVDGVVGACQSRVALGVGA